MQLAQARKVWFVGVEYIFASAVYDAFLNVACVTPCRAAYLDSEKAS